MKRFTWSTSTEVLVKLASPGRTFLSQRLQRSGRALVGVINHSPSFYLNEWASTESWDKMVKLGETEVPLKDMLPYIHSWSDVSRILWSHLAGASKGQLRYFQT